MKILITGGAGYIGSVLTSDLLKKNYKVIIVDNFSYSENSLSALCLNKNLEIIKSDFRDINYYKKELNSSDIIIPLAGLVGAPMCKKFPHEAKSINLDGQINILREVSNEQIVLMPTTNSAYGTSNGNVCDENTSLKPISLYAKHKVNVEQELMLKKNRISFRLATVFGMSPRMRLDLLVNDFVFRALNEKFVVLFEQHFKRNYIHVKDVSKVFVHGIINFEEMKGNIFNVGLSNANLSKLELCNEIKKFINFKIIIDEIEKDPDQRNYIVSNKKIEDAGFKADFSLKDGIEELLKGYTGYKFRKFSNV